MSSIPLDDPEKFDLWVRQRWLEKEQLLEQYVLNGRFPADEGHGSEAEPAENGSGSSKVIHGPGFIETEVKLAHWYEIGQIFLFLAVWALIADSFVKLWKLVVGRNLTRKRQEVT